MAARRLGPAWALGLTWSEAAQLAVVVASAWTGPLLHSPSALDPTARPWPTPIPLMVLGVFIVAVLRRWPAAFDTARHGGAIMLGFLGLGLSGLGTYVYLVESWTCSYYAESRIVGGELTPYAAEYLWREPATSCEELLKRFTGRADEIWTQSSSLHRELVLTALHLCVLAAFMVLALLVTRLLLQGRRERVARAIDAGGEEPQSGDLDAGTRLLPLALELSRIVLVHEDIKRHATMALRCPDLVAIPNPAHARALWLAVLQRAEIEGRIPRLVALVLDDNPAADQLRALAREWLPAELPGTLPETLAPHPR